VCVPLLDGEDVLAAADCAEVVVGIELPSVVLAAAGTEVEYSSTPVVAVAGAVSVAKLLPLASALLKTALGIGVPAIPHANFNGVRSMFASISLSHWVCMQVRASVRKSPVPAARQKHATSNVLQISSWELERHV